MESLYLKIAESETELESETEEETEVEPNTESEEESSSAGRTTAKWLGAAGGALGAGALGYGLLRRRSFAPMGT